MSTITIVDFWNKLNNHDWFYNMSDDASVFRNGMAKESELKKSSEQSEEHSRLFKEFEDYYRFNGPEPKLEKGEVKNE